MKCGEYLAHCRQWSYKRICEDLKREKNNAVFLNRKNSTIFFPACQVVRADQSGKLVGGGEIPTLY